MSPQNLTFRRVTKQRRAYRRFTTPMLHVGRKAAYLNIEAREDHPITGINWHTSEDGAFVYIEPVYGDEGDEHTYRFGGTGPVGMPVGLRENFGPIPDDDDTMVCYALMPYEGGWIFSEAEQTECP